MAAPTRRPGYAVSRCIRKRAEEAFGWAKRVVGLRKPRYRGLPKVDWQFTRAMVAYDLVRLPKNDRPADAMTHGSQANRVSVSRFCHTANHRTTPYSHHRPRRKSRGTSV